MSCIYCEKQKEKVLVHRANCERCAGPTHRKLRASDVPLDIQREITEAYLEDYAIERVTSTDNWQGVEKCQKEE